jgi:hypothetical protein
MNVVLSMVRVCCNSVKLSREQQQQSNSEKVSTFKPQDTRVDPRDFTSSYDGVKRKTTIDLHQSGIRHSSNDDTIYFQNHVPKVPPHVSPET